MIESVLQINRCRPLRIFILIVGIVTTIIGTAMFSLSDGRGNFPMMSKAIEYLRTTRNEVDPGLNIVAELRVPGIICDKVERTISKTSVQRSVLRQNFLAQRKARIRNQIINASSSNEIANRGDTANEKLKSPEIENETVCVNFTVTNDEVAQVCIYKSEINKDIFSALRKTRVWEANILQQVCETFTEEPYLEFLDVGCDIGVYTIAVANIGSRVVSTVVNKERLRNLEYSLQVNNLAQNVTLLWNAVSNETFTTRSTLKAPLDEPSKAITTVSAENDNTDNVPKVIMLDDLVKLFIDKKIFIKIGLDGQVWQVLTGGKRFFRFVDVRYVLIKWTYLRGKDTEQNVVNFMTDLDYHPYDADDKKIRLLYSEIKHWPEHILWIKK